MKTAAETEAALTGTFLNRGFRVVFLCHLGKVEVCTKKKKAEHQGFYHSFLFGRLASRASALTCCLNLGRENPKTQAFIYLDIFSLIVILKKNLSSVFLDYFNIFTLHI